MASFLPLSRLAGSLALSFTGAGQEPSADPPAVVPQPPPPAATEAPPTPAQPPPPAAAPQMSDAERPTRARPIERDEPRPHLLRATDRRFFFTLLVGGSKALAGGYFSYLPGMDFKIEGAIGGYGRHRRNLAGAAVLQVSSGFPLSSFTLAPRLQWRRELLPDYAFYMVSHLQLGYRMESYGYGIIPLGGAYHGAMLGFGWGAQAIVAERLLLAFRPVNVEISGPGLGIVRLGWDVMGGLGVVW